MTALLLGTPTLAVAQEARELRLSAMFGDHMVLPRDVAIPMSGSARPGATIEIEFGDVRLEATANASGLWAASLSRQVATATPRTLMVLADGHTVRCTDVVVGDVWLCAGQSNMAFPLSRSADGAAALERADLPNLRLAQLTPRVSAGSRAFAAEILESLAPATLYRTDGWQRSDSTTASPFSAVAWHFGTRMAAELDVPIGLVHVAFGGSPIEAWIPVAALAVDPALAPLLDDWLVNPEYPAWCRGRARRNLSAWTVAPDSPTPRHPFEPGILFEAAVEPRATFPFRGVLWYQGESNATVDGGLGQAVDAATNERKLRALVSSWRAALGQPELPFVMAQLPGLDRDWAPFREVQARVAADDDGVFLAITIDLGHPTDVHPKRKAPVGDRMARLALAHLFGKDIVSCGPVLDEIKVEASGALRVHFAHAAGLETSDGKPPRCFEVAGRDGHFHSAVASIERETVLLRSPEVPEPTSARYAWENDPPTNLVNAVGLPAAPFRSDR